MNILLSVQNLTVSFKNEQQGWVKAVQGLSFDVASQQTVAIVGESGSGKSVSALAIMGLLADHQSQVSTQSRIEFEGQDLLKLSPQAHRHHCGRDLAMIFQEPMSSLNPVFNIGSQIAEALALHHSYTATKLKARVIELLEEVGIREAEKRYYAYPSQLSGGQQQRVMIAIALACQPKLLIADEPTTALDVTIQQQIISLLKQLCESRKMSMIFITHDLALVAELADRVIVMRQGSIREQGEMWQILNHPQDHYSRALLYCRPRMDQRPMRLPVISDFIDHSGQALPPSDLDHVQAQRQRGLTGLEPIILEAKHLSKSFTHQTGLWHKTKQLVVEDVSFKLAKGKTLGLVGESGSGKTTIGMLLMRLQQADAGQVLIDGQDILHMTAQQFSHYQSRIQIIFQNPYASLNPRFSIGKIITEPMRIQGIKQREPLRSRAIDLLERVGLPASAYDLYPHEFSGGQRQRIAIARCLALQPEIIICDESVSALDVSVQAQVLNLLQELQDELQLSYIFISHDLAVIKYISDQVMVMQHGKIVEVANADVLYHSPKHPYTQQLLNAIPTALQHQF